jgi:hypothetical protein
MVMEYPDLKKPFYGADEQGRTYLFLDVEQLTTTNILKGVDIRNDNAILISPKYLKK